MAGAKKQSCLKLITPFTDFTKAEQESRLSVMLALMAAAGLITAPII